jgi:hypothetical protein
VRRDDNDLGFGYSLLFGDEEQRSPRLRIPRRWSVAALTAVIVLPIALVVAIGLVLAGFGSQIRVTGVYAYQAGTFHSCQAQVTVRGDIVTNGTAGTVRYQWVWPDGVTSAVTKARFAAGQDSRQVTAPWTFPSTENGANISAMLRVLEPDAKSAHARLFYLCAP